MKEHFKNIYFLGIGGIGMSALARWFNANGYKVAGYDRTRSALCAQLESEGIDIHYHEALDAIPRDMLEKELSLIVYTPAVPKEHVELRYFEENGFLLKKRAEVLGLLTESHFTVAIAGTHGKTTTSSMVAHVLRSVGLNISAFIGGITQNYQSNLLLADPSKGEQIMVVEADEFDRSFLHLKPNIAIVTTMDADHLDIYGSEDAVKASFQQFCEKVLPEGVLIVREGIELQVPEGRKMHRFGMDAQYSAKNIRIAQGKFRFDIEGSAQVKELELLVPGYHNVMNALAAFIAASALGVDAEKIAKALADFKGVKRRFEYHVRNEHFIYIDDYAHHPTEIQAFLSSVKALYPDKKVVAIFQPHLYSRTRDFMHEFAEALAICDELILLPIYPARELPIPGISSEKLLDEVRLEQKSVCEKADLLEKLKHLQADVLVTIGAGDIDSFVSPIKELFDR